ncbi:ABC transporter ATP-binding protein [Seohaeicola sp. SP36]|uniref:ABC transporter ATP-binding protein n=1 Tax=unclassified Seohaeicola TaxID=2641111 RepID=UPI00237B794F|nr:MULTISPECIES: ABC transporter ATP-binding protein [unclassified Seohaeicola]MDD9709016.1 ABC transporter ATP-binding protein [Seohaeicola sp. 4SK31]MDD9737102.1 ABC transporter ATP-binding protein [Seohaeicola sp. SP36]
MSRSAGLEVRNLTVSYGKHRALEDASITVRPGEIVVILGANGAGKSTLLKAISGICEGQVSGQITLYGEDLTTLPANRILDQGVALVPEGRGVFGDLTVRENLILGAYSARAREDQASNLDRVHELFPKLIERSGQVVRTMSGGEQQMVAIGRAMMSNPNILTLDEPSLGLSPLLCKELFQNLKKVRDLGIGILLVEQNAKQSLAIADRGYLLENAHIVHEDSAAALRNDPAVQSAYLGAGGAAAPHTHDAAQGPSGRDAVPSEAAPQTFAVSPRPSQTVSADMILGRSVADLVAQASQRQQSAVTDRRQTAPAQAAQQNDRIAATLAEIERAAQAARRPRVVERSRPQDRARDSAPQTSQRQDSHPASPPVTIEVYRAPRVEVWRRRPGGNDFDRS